MKRPQRGLATGLAAVLVGAIVPLTTAASASASSCYSYKLSEKKFARKTNAARSRAGLSKLHLDPQLSRVSRFHTGEMVKDHSLYHTTETQFDRRVTNWAVVGENIGYGGGVDSLQRAFMKSPAHHANIMHKGYRYLGVGVIKKNGLMWVTVEFESQRDPGTRLKMPTC
jgi:uncharacterized protein YkwD